MKAKDDLVRIFVSLDVILYELWEKENYAYTENDINEIKNLLSEYLEDYLKVNSEEKCKYIELFRDIQFESELIGFEKSLELANNPEELLKKIVPYLYAIKKKKFRIEFLSDYLFDKIYDRTFFEKLKKGALNLGFVAIKAVIAGAAKAAGAAVIAASVLGPGPGLIASLGVAGVAGAAVIEIGIEAVAVDAGVGAALNLLGLGKANTALEKYKKAIENQYKFNITWGENKVYEEIVKSINKNNDTKKKTIRDN